MSFLTRKEKTAVEEAVKKAESKTSGEIVVAICYERIFKENFATPKKVQKAVEKRAMKEFKRLKIGKTRNSTGCLLLIAVNDKFVTVFGDRPINKKMKDGWPKVVEFVLNGIKSGKPAEGIIKAVERIGERLAEHFPICEDDTNELSDFIVEIL